METLEKIKSDWEKYQRNGRENADPGKPWGWQWGSDKIVKQVMAMVGGYIYPPVVEIGCGGGKWTKALCDLAGDVIATDVHEVALKESAEYEPRARYKLSDGETIPVKKKSVSTVFTWDVLLHLPPTLVLRYFREARRVAKCTFVFALPNLMTERGGFMFADAALHRSWRDVESYGYMHYYTPQHIEQMLTIAGWKEWAFAGNAGTPEARDAVYVARIG
jgi:SAM-dependent methyltransferase